MKNYLNVHICTDEMIKSGKLNGEWLHLPMRQSDIEFAIRDTLAEAKKQAAKQNAQRSMGK